MVLKVGRELFNITGQDHIVLIDKTGALSGDYLKHINYLRPQVIVRLKKLLSENNNTGQIITIDRFHFIVARDSYRNKWTQERIDFASHFVYMLIAEHEDKKFKTTEDYDFLKLNHERLEIISW